MNLSRLSTCVTSVKCNENLSRFLALIVSLTAHFRFRSYLRDFFSLLNIIVRISVLSSFNFLYSSILFDEAFFLFIREILRQNVFYLFVLFCFFNARPIISVHIKNRTFFFCSLKTCRPLCFRYCFVLFFSFFFFCSYFLLLCTGTINRHT